MSEFSVIEKTLITKETLVEDFKRFSGIWRGF
jgi:hypothetical protein